MVVAVWVALVVVAPWLVPVAVTGLLLPAVTKLCEPLDTLPRPVVIALDLLVSVVAA